MIGSYFPQIGGLRQNKHSLSLLDLSGSGPGHRKSIAAALPLCALLATVLVGLLDIVPHQAKAESTQSAQAFFQGKTVTLIVPYGAAGGYEYWAAALKPYLEKALGASRIDIVNKPGGGGLVGEDNLYQATPDGLTIGEVNGGGSIFAQIIDKPGVNFDMTKFGWLGSPDVETTITAARSGAPYKSFADMWKLRGGADKVVGLSAGYGGEDYVGTALPLATFGIPYQMLVAYQGSSAAKAGLLRGDGDIASYGYSVFRPFIQSNSVVALYITAANPSTLLPGLPTIVQLAGQYKLSQTNIHTLEVFAHAVNMGKDWAAPPGVPADRLEFLRTAFRQAAQDPAFLDTAKKVGRVGGYTSPDDLQQTIASVIKNKSAFTPYLKQ